MIRAIACIATVMGANECSSGPKTTGLSKEAKGMLGHKYIGFFGYGKEHISKGRSLCEDGYKPSMELSLLWRKYLKSEDDKADFRTLNCKNGVFSFSNLKFGPIPLKQNPCKLKGSRPSVPKRPRPSVPRACRKGSYRFHDPKNKLVNIKVTRRGTWCKHNGQRIKVKCQQYLNFSTRTGVSKMAVTDMQGRPIVCPTLFEAQVQAEVDNTMAEFAEFDEVQECKPFVVGNCDKYDTEKCPGECEI